MFSLFIVCNMKNMLSCYLKFLNHMAYCKPLDKTKQDLYHKMVYDLYFTWNWDYDVSTWEPFIFEFLKYDLLSKLGIIRTISEVISYVLF